ncbi:MAG: twin-arginine translocase TatA/TatE family subunit [Gemmatimonadaceae bacterium]|nr:twin-arginine translocase TatA/TatE family subunit [Gemmatimonadaceae bacterium]
MFGMGPMEMFLAAVVVLLLFGAKRIPEIAGSFGKGIKEFKRNMSDAQREIAAPSEPAASLPTAADRAREDEAREPKRLG